MTQTTIRPDFPLPEHVRDVWRLRHGTAVLAASVWTHPSGIEVRIVDELNQLLYAQAYRDPGAWLADTGR